MTLATDKPTEKKRWTEAEFMALTDDSHSPAAQRSRMGNRGTTPFNSQPVPSTILMLTNQTGFL